MKLQIKKPMDTNEFYTTILSGSVLYDSGFRVRDGHTHVQNIRPLTTNHHDIMHHAIASFFKDMMGTRTNRRYSSRGLPPTYTGTLLIGGCPIFIERKNGRISLNGTSLSLEQAADSLARVAYRSCFITDTEDLMKFMYSTLTMPENIRYVLENRLPYYFYADYERHDVRVNVQRTGNSTCAVEISDGLWGEITFKELDKYCNFYIHNKKRSNWKYVSPANLFNRLVGRKPSEAELELMIAFLQQNRKQDIVEERALSLIKDMVEQNPDKLFPVWEGDDLSALFVKGKGHDWKLTNTGYKEGTQLVSTFVWEKQSASPISEENTLGWRGPICIDNMSRNSSVGDQFAARAMALMNDTFTMSIVSTIRSYIKSEENENRIDINEMRGMQK